MSSTTSYNPNQSKIDNLSNAKASFLRSFKGPISASNCTEEMFQKYVLDLLAYISPKTQEHYSLGKKNNCIIVMCKICILHVGTIVTYLSAIKEHLKSVHPSLPLWTKEVNRDGTPKWYTDMRNYICRMCTNRVVEAGKKLVNKSDPIGRPLLSKICTALLRKNDFDSIEMRAAFVTDFHSCGRTGEIATASYATASWDDIECCLKTDWSMEKTSQQKLLYLYPDYEQYQICVYHSIACLMS
jgi:hypothetical protein